MPISQPTLIQQLKVQAVLEREAGSKEQVDHTLKLPGLEVGAWMTTLKLKMALKPETVQVSPVVIVIPAK